MKKHKGFTIVELLIVIVVISILAGITTVIYSGITARAYDSKKLAELTNLVKQLELYRHENDCVPTRCPGENSRKSEDIIVYNSKSSQAPTGIIRLGLVFRQRDLKIYITSIYP